MHESLPAFDAWVRSWELAAGRRFSPPLRRLFHESWKKRRRALSGARVPPVSLPQSMQELESRLFSLAGERMVHEPLVSVLMHADHSASRVLHDHGRALRDPVEDFFTRRGNSELRDFLSQNEWEAVVSAFLSWAGGDDEASYVEALDAVDDAPPERGAELRAWLAEHEVEEALQHPLALVAPLAPTFRARDKALRSPSSTIADGLGGILPGRLGNDLQAAARSYLAWVAGRRKLDARREQLWQRVPDSPRVAAAVDRIRGVLDALRDRGVAPLPLPAAETEVEVDPRELLVRMSFSHPHGYGGHGEAWISLVERTDERARASLDSDKVQERRHPERLGVLTERVLDALHDPDDRLHDELRVLLEKPRWDRLLAELEREVQPDAGPPPPFEEGERLVWRIARTEGEPTVEAAIQKRRKRGGWTKGRVTEARELPYQPGLDVRDRRVAEALVSPGRFAPGRGGLGAVFEALIGHPRVIFTETSQRPVRVKRGQVSVSLVERDEATWIRFRLQDEVFEPHEMAAARVEPRHAIFLDEASSVVTVVDLPDSVLAMAEACARWETGLPADADDTLLKLLYRLPPSVGVELPPRLRGAPRDPDQRPVLRLEPLPGGGLRVTVAMRPLPGGAVQPPGEGPTQIVGLDGSERVHTVRDLPAERRLAEQVGIALGLDAGESDGPHTVRLDEPEDALELLHRMREQPDLATVEWPEDQTPWRVVGSAGFGNLKVRSKKLTDWFALEGEAELDEGKVRLAQIMAALREGRRYVKLGKGRFARIEDDLRTRLNAAQDVVFEEAGELGVSGAAIGELEAILPEDRFEADAEWLETKKRLEAASELHPEVPEGLRADLRSYQREGITWLERVASWASGACLADDMGLGKTLQALALALERQSDGPTLVVCPTSLSDNWRKECERFSPTLRPRIYRGPDRGTMVSTFAPGDLVITSYDILLRDIDALREVHFALTVFDEAHALKNPEAARTKAARQLDAGFRLALTGTPLENHLGELWSLYSILVPGLLGPWKHFRARFAIPIERDNDLAKRERLRELLRPFLLRRTKAQVAPELPPRTEVVRSIELSDDERALYEAERRQALEQLAAKAEDPKRRFAVLGALTRLRRLACHPTLVHPESRVSSSKLTELMELAADLRREGHRSLVFSQFTTHLAIVRRALEAKGWEVLYLDGSTPAAKRGELVDRWQRGEAPFFLISLKAGGTGLNLTAADTVIHLDPWWNPAVEDQASDRTHRIGQDKPVTVVRLVSQGTIEEAVMQLHEQKRELARGILEGAETNAKLSVDDLLELLEG